ncbi:uncharacterized protein Z519_10620 [Cladophialophora bantiana CBS 173.52]|uniref:Uncharacterized protein n=1 Tax=Cladophialophora bantiana (strain ATCC 10958 / CBS 173.52 / CDC B-1940 / NIH 8579) TaxID=1442370 RepID=A0A0D2HVK9_CLAB1|nr:uncharacterized protein Z519_10620 [Cladophialophora bantiana CBS 173.52]KIW88574.1 hypothetical protein Z519_10620 [Cladophialophora bantiana CBS 173.52]
MEQDQTPSQKPGHPPAQAILHELRTTENSAAHLLPKLQSMKESNPHLTLLDGGAGSGTISVLIHIGTPWDALREMLRVTERGGIVAAREGDYETECVWPELPKLRYFHKLMAGLMSAGGGTPTTGRELLSWALKAGVERSQIRSAIVHRRTIQRARGKSAVGIIIPLCFLWLQIWL